MLLKSQELRNKNKDFFKNKITLLYGENEDLIKNLNDSILLSFHNEKKIAKIFFEEDILKEPNHFINYYLNGSLFEEKNISIIKNCSDKILEIINQIKTHISETTIILNSNILLKNSKLRQFSEFDKTGISIPCYQENRFDIKKILMEKINQYQIKLSESHIENIINSSSLKRSKINEIIEKINLYKNSGQITDKFIEEICTDQDLKKNEEIIDILLSKKEKNINELISNMSNYEKNFIEVIIILRLFIIKIIDIQKSNKGHSLDEKIEQYKPAIFWKDKDRIKNILKIWNTNSLKALLGNLNILETEFKKNELNQDIQFYYFITQNLSKISSKNSNNFI